ncbi:hypothetical protein ADL04_27485 [Streptomyces sp. NRRL B-3648]|nr:hypothetical protein ADL04_27485 [Streptomyces sp. NRRL B-3648]
MLGIDDDLAESDDADVSAGEDVAAGTYEGVGREDDRPAYEVVLQWPSRQIVTDLPGRKTGWS